jgi:hypothetical protein
MNEKENPSTDILNNINNQFKELIDLIEKENAPSVSMKSFEKKKKSNKKWWILCFLIILFITIYMIRCNEELSYNIYFVFLSFIRLILIKVSPKTIDLLNKFIFLFKILPYWDWTTVYTNQCFITNPFFNHSLDATECKVNEHMQGNIKL